MKFFIDTANLDQIREANDLGVLDGVTTNPSLMAKEGIKGDENCRKHYVEICNIVDGDVSAEVIATDYEGMIKEGEELAALHPNIVVKVPCIADGIKAIKYFTNKGIRTNCTLVFSPGQALLAAKAGATYVSPFVGRLDDISSDGIELVEKIVELKTQHPEALVLAHPECKSTVLKLADVVGSTAALLKYAVNHPENTYIVATESGILHEMQKKCPQTTFIPAPPNDSTCGCNECSFMRLNTLEKLYECLKNESPEITVDPEIAEKAVRPIQRMLEISAKLGL